MTEEQEKAFKLAEQKATELMSALYNVRNHFYIGNKIPYNGTGVWCYIPRAQSILHLVEQEIKNAKESVLMNDVKS